MLIVSLYILGFNYLIYPGIMAKAYTYHITGLEPKFIQKRANFMVFSRKVIDSLKNSIGIMDSISYLLDDYLNKETMISVVRNHAQHQLSCLNSYAQPGLL